MVKWDAIARRIRVPLGFAFTVLYVLLAQPTWASMAIGAIFVAIGLATRAVASGHVRKNENLSTSGPYAHTRNPLYLGSLMTAIGFVLAARNFWIAVALLVMFYAIYSPVIRGEEAFLRQKFPEYEEYARQVPRIFPTIKAFTGVEQNNTSFSFELYRKHREYQAFLGAAALMAVLAVKLSGWVRR